MDDMDDEEMVTAGVLCDPGKGTEEALNLKVAETIKRFLGEKSWVTETLLRGGTTGTPRVDGKICHQSRGWKVMAVLGYSLDEAVIRDIQNRLHEI